MLLRPLLLIVRCPLLVKQQNITEKCFFAKANRTRRRFPLPEGLFCVCMCVLSILLLVNTSLSFILLLWSDMITRQVETNILSIWHIVPTGVTALFIQQVECVWFAYIEIQHLYVLSNSYVPAEKQKNAGKSPVRMSSAMTSTCTSSECWEV